MYQKGWINQKDGQYLLNHCNLIGPSFVGSYVLSTKLNLPEYFLMTVCILYFPHLVCILLYFFKRQPDTQAKHNVYIPDNTFTTRKATPRLRNCFQILNVAIMNGFETITILGGYLILFGIFCAFVKEIQFLPTGLRACILAFLEITIGIHEISILEISGMVKYLCAIPLLSRLMYGYADLVRLHGRPLFYEKLYQRTPALCPHKWSAHHLVFFYSLLKKDSGMSSAGTLSSEAVSSAFGSGVCGWSAGASGSFTSCGASS